MFVLNAVIINIIAVLKNKLPKKNKYISIYYVSEIDTELLSVKSLHMAGGAQSISSNRVRS